MDNETILEEDSRLYVNPKTSAQEQQAFIETIRDLQAKNVNEINRNTYELGSPVSSNVGGLGGTERMLEARYVTPQAQVTAAGLNAAMKQSVLNTELKNISNYWRNQFNQAQGRYQRAASTYPTTTNPNNKNGEIDPKEIPEGTLDTLPSGEPNATATATGDVMRVRIDDYIESTQVSTNTPISREYDNGRVDQYQNGKWVTVTYPTLPSSPTPVSPLGPNGFVTRLPQSGVII